MVVERQITVYEASDGKTFDTEREAAEHDFKLWLYEDSAYGGIDVIMKHFDFQNQGVLIMEINLQGSTRCSRLFARKTWQALMTLHYKEHGDLKAMDSFLCDLYILTLWFDEVRHSADLGGFTIWWECQGSWTEIADYELPDSFKIDFNFKRNTILIEKV